MEITIGREVYIDLDDEDVLYVERIVYPLGNEYGNNYYDGVKYEKGKTKVKKSHYGGGNTWSRRGSLDESWENEDIEFISIEEFEQLKKRVKEIAAIEDEIDREAAAREFVNKIIRKEFYSDC
ncbi:MAG: hypothetical protein QW469_01275 [Candidatus Aenigmatarchaeota archaeon]